MVLLNKMQMFEVINHFVEGCGRYTPLDLVKRAGQITMSSNGHDQAALYFLRSFLTSHLDNDMADPGNFLTIAVRKVENPEEKLRQAVEIMEYAYAFLNLHLDKLRPEMKWQMTAVINFPPDSGFFDRVAEKMKAVKADERAAIGLFTAC